VRQKGGIKVLRQKSCPRCKTGNVSIDRDQYGWYEYCIQCGYVRDLISVVESKQEPACGGKKVGQEQVCGVKKGERKPKTPDKGE
jgi:hypothetical protein